MCDFCCSVHQIDIHTYKDRDNGIERYVFIDKGVLAIEVYQNTGGFSIAIREEINYCPMCGRKL